MLPKDRFSTQANLYAQFRPTYPQELYDFIFQYVDKFENAWDCATGNGQVARILAQKFQQVEATDISQKQLDNAFQASNIHYQISQAEKTPFADATFDLITVGQAIHWFNFEAFYQEIKRIAKPNALLAFWGYGTLLIEEYPTLNQDFQHFYQEQIGSYWDGERGHIDQKYTTIPFPFESIPTPEFSMQYFWNFDQLEGYLNTWSSVQRYIQQNGSNPVTEFIQRCREKYTENLTFQVSFPIFLKAGKIEQ